MLEHVWRRARAARRASTASSSRPRTQRIVDACRSVRRRGDADLGRAPLGHRPRRRGRRAGSASRSTSWSTSRGTSRSSHRRASIGSSRPSTREPQPAMATLVEPLDDRRTISSTRTWSRSSPTTRRARALLLARADPVPSRRGDRARCAISGPLWPRVPAGSPATGKHQGIYAYTPRHAARADRGCRPSPLELDEGLEQLRALAGGLHDPRRRLRFPFARRRHPGRSRAGRSAACMEASVMTRRPSAAPSTSS